jgi:hypothetical protein
VLALPSPQAASDAPRRRLPEGEVRSTRITPFGIAYEVIVIIDGLNGRTVSVVTTWMVATNAAPRLTSTWVDIP